MAEQKSKKNADSTNGISFTEIISGVSLNKFLIKNTNYILFIFILVIAYISNSYHAESVARRTYSLEKEIKQLKAEYIENVSNNMYSRLQTQIQQKIDSLNMKLEIPREPPKKIVVDYE